jgi:hypothetical protein
MSNTIYDVRDLRHSFNTSGTRPFFQDLGHSFSRPALAAGAE